ncbi:ATP-dependent DNA helicase PIF1-like protein [Tanacetum coccineum]|uniref:ATP-dependent DNA helicase n=1 Tax=Tanacetum coccineum TaxID=301880 RepID=A0ABQ5CYX8_9ASTR
MYRPEEYDEVVSAEIPNETDHPHLHRMVVKHMLHGPCGELNPNNVCMKKNGTCKNSYPKAYSDETTQTTDAYPIYRRRNNGVTVKVRKAKLDNRWVIPYNAYLLAKFDCHINVEICSTIKAVKYIYKYICKGSDRISFSVSSDNGSSLIDEIDQYQSGRWVSPPEGAWRIFRFLMSEMKPAVIHLQLHLENYQPLTFKKKDKLANVLQNPIQRKTMLTEFFAMNRTDKAAQSLNLTYSEFPDHFVWVQDKKFWKRRQIGDSVGRIVAAHPSEGERYYLRILLSKVRCPKSFDDLKKCNGVRVATFREAALLRGYLVDDNSQRLCLEEASLFHLPYELRRLFATLLVYSCPNSPRELWLAYENAMLEDLLRYNQMTRREATKIALQQINGFLQSMGKNIQDFGIVPQEFSSNELEDQAREIRAEKDIIVSQEDLDAIFKLNERQKSAFETIIEKAYSSGSGAFFVDGPGGTGKTYLYRALLAEVRSKGHIALATATSGIAASILPGGRTAHSRFKIPLDAVEGSGCRVSKQSSLAALIRDSRLIIWDEAPMAKRSAIEALNDLLQDLMNSTELFGGKVVVHGGDFRQTLPVVRKAKNGSMGNQEVDQAVGHATVSKHTSPTWNEDFESDDEVDEVIFPEGKKFDDQFDIRLKGRCVIVCPCNGLGCRASPTPFVLKRLFGVIYFTGETFYQKKGTKSETLDACITNSPIWPSLQKLRLEENMRALLDPIFTEFLLKIGNGTETSHKNDLVNIPPSMLIQTHLDKDPLDALIDCVYPNTQLHSLTTPCSLNRAILTTKNSFVDEINEILIARFPGEETEYASFDETLDPNDQTQYEDFLHSLTPNGMPPHRLVLKPNSPIILLRNLNPTEGLCNGIRLICKDLKRNVIHAKIASGDFAGKQVFIHRIPLQPLSDEDYTVPFKRVQFPIRLCFAMTINKAQGQTLDFVGVYLKEPVFSHGQLYVALSRARTAKHAKVLIRPPLFDTPNIRET